MQDALLLYSQERNQPTTHNLLTTLHMHMSTYGFPRFGVIGIIKVMQAIHKRNSSESILRQLLEGLV